jgi:hypothetical protein
MVYVLRSRPGLHASVAEVEAGDEVEQDVAVLPRALHTIETIDDNVVRPVTVRTGNPEIYGKDAFWPSRQAALSEAVMGTNSYLRLAVYPARYNPVAQQLRVAGWVRVRVSFDELDDPDTTQRP